jgi:hypothetical protein
VILQPALGGTVELRAVQVSETEQETYQSCTQLGVMLVVLFGVRLTGPLVTGQLLHHLDSPAGRVRVMVLQSSSSRGVLDSRVRIMYGVTEREFQSWCFRVLIPLVLVQTARFALPMFPSALVLNRLDQCW